MKDTDSAPIVVVGGGVIGMCTAYYLAGAGVPVEVVERQGIGSGASWGNAGWVCMSHSAPVPSPGVIGYAARSLGRPDSPLYLRPRLDPRFLAWLVRFWRSSSASRFRTGYQAVADLNRRTFELYDGLAADGVETTLHRPGMVHAFLSADEARHHLAVQRQMSAGRYVMPEEPVVGPTARALDPALSADVTAAYLVEGEGVVDSAAFVRALRDRLGQLGAKVHENIDVSGFAGPSGRIDKVLTNAGEIPCSGVVVASGVRSAQLLAALGLRLPMQAGKGYSFGVDLPTPPKHALYFGERRVVASPIGSTTRIAGTMELSGNNNRLDWRRLTAVARASRRYLGPWFSEPDDLMSAIRDPWVGGRPFLPDGLPVIDRVPGRENVYLATGHGMLGVTLGPATGRYLTDYVLGGSRPEALAPFSFDRIGA
ncbi:NAD(P)/FAD-dependent oxidoreductase [Catenulispora rubra]|uniref:NAD(P)/FAD-dependent oxidoreductase n=1 Tax=Catenulispora rubra TaxID=280293 RepID=UPI002B278BFA|nr:FAD-dependent oxidoreductase [Catenulispora rubra]